MDSLRVAGSGFIRQEGIHIWAKPQVRRIKTKVVLPNWGMDDEAGIRLHEDEQASPSD
jgi:hypothetical protein